jgi:hypothetical protein
MTQMAKYRSDYWFHCPNCNKQSFETKQAGAGAGAKCTKCYKSRLANTNGISVFCYNHFKWHRAAARESIRQISNKSGKQNWAAKVCQRHKNQPLNAGVSPQGVQKGTVGLNQHFSLGRVSLSYGQGPGTRRRQID